MYFLFLRCNTFALGEALNNKPKFLIKNVKKKIPLNRWTKKDGYRKVIQFLASQKKTYIITSLTVIVNGGRTVW